MSPPDTMTPAALAVVVFEVAVVVAGLAAIWLCVLRPRARASARTQLTPWRLEPLDFGCFLGFVVVGVTLPSALVGWALRAHHAGDAAFTIAGGAVLDVGILLGLAGFFLTYGPVRSNSSGGTDSLPAVVRSGLVTFAIGMPLVFGTGLVWDLLLTRLGLPTDEQDSVKVLQSLHSGWLVLALMLTATVLAPVAEEYVFRAGLFRYFRTRAPRWLSIVLVSMLFAAMHQSWVSFMPLTVLAIVFCLAYERTGSIWTTIIAHALFNLNTFALIMSGIGS